MTHSSTLAVNAQGTMQSLHYPLYRVQGYAYWIVLETAVIMVREGWIFYWLEGQPDFERNHLDARAMAPCDRSEVKGAYGKELTVLEMLFKLL
jgi:hypothetical protein